MYNSSEELALKEMYPLYAEMCDEDEEDYDEDEDYDEGEE